MNKATLIFTFLFLSSMSLFSQDKATMEVEKAVAELTKRILDPTEANLKEITLPELTYGHSSGALEDQAAFVEALASGKSDFTALEVSDQTIKVSGNTAWVRHVLKGDYVANGNTSKINLKVLLIWVKTDGQWKLLARQAARNA